MVGEYLITRTGLRARDPLFPPLETTKSGARAPFRVTIACQPLHFYRAGPGQVARLFIFVEYPSGDGAGNLLLREGKHFSRHNLVHSSARPLGRSPSILLFTRRWQALPM